MSTPRPKMPPVKPVRQRVQIRWAQVAPELIRAYVDAATEQGCAVILGRTINGSALSICVLAGNGKEKDYAGTLDDVELIFEDIFHRLDLDQPPAF